MAHPFSSVSAFAALLSDAVACYNASSDLVDPVRLSGIQTNSDTKKLVKSGAWPRPNHGAGNRCEFELPQKQERS